MTNVQFPYAFYLLGAGAGAAYFFRLPLRLHIFLKQPWLLFFSQAALAPRGQEHATPFGSGSSALSLSQC